MTTDVDEAWIARARQSLAGAQSELDAGRYANAINRIYYASYQAAVAWLMRAGVKQARGNPGWPHRYVWKQFEKEILGKSKNPALPQLASHLSDVWGFRVSADYLNPVENPLLDQGERDMRRALSLTRLLVGSAERAMR